MYFSVELTPEVYKALGEHVPEYFVLIPVWRDVSVVVLDDDGQPRLLELSCDEKQIEAMLCIATLHYRAALPMIQKAIDRSRS